MKVSTLYTTEGSLENFELVFDILRWLIDQYEPGTIILGSSETEAERILLAKSCVEFFIVKTGIKLSALRLYAASSASARQLLKVVELIMQRPVDVLEQRDKQNFNTMSRIDDSINVRHRSKDLSTELMHLGASLFELLGKEKDNQEKRNIQTGRQLEQSNTDKLMTGVITGANLKLSRDRERLKTVLTEKQAISAKVDRKKADLERLKQRLDTLQKIRPAFSEEFDRAEEELQKLYSIYFKYVRCLDVLRAQSNSGANNSPAIFESTKNGSASQSMVTLPEGILDLSEDLSNDEDETGDDILDSNPEDLKASAKNVDEEEKIAEKAKLRIKTGGRLIAHFRLNEHIFKF